MSLSGTYSSRRGLVLNECINSYRSFCLPFMSSSPQPRRTNAVVACSNCRKHKTRCEMLDPFSGRCHRCEIASLACSHEGQCGVIPWADPLVQEFGQSTPSSPSSSSISATTLLGSPYEALSPSSPGRAWSFIPQLLECSAPIAAIHMLSERLSPATMASPVLLTSDYSIHDILSPMQIEYLLGVSVLKPPTSTEY